MEICEQQSENGMRHLPSISIYVYVGGRTTYLLWALEWVWQLGQSIGIDETNKFQLKFFGSMKIVGATGLGGLWALEWACKVCGRLVGVKVGVANFRFVGVKVGVANFGSVDRY